MAPINRTPLTCLFLLVIFSPKWSPNPGGNAAQAKSPNIVMILADDCTHNDLPMYGGQNARTPNLEQLATEGLTFNRAYLAEAMCQPCRAELYTGLYPMRNGCAWNHSSSLPETMSMPQIHIKLWFANPLKGHTQTTKGQLSKDPGQEVVPG